VFRYRFTIILFLLSLSIFGNIHAKEPHANKPLIGILLNDGGEGGYSIYPWYAMRKNYGEIVTKMGGVPVFIGHDVAVIQDYLQKLDGIVLTGGDLKSPPTEFENGQHKPVDPKLYPREAVEYVLIQEAYKRDIPLLGICAGMQDMNVALDGTIGNLKEAGKTTIEHRVENREEVQHEINVAPKSMLYCIVKKKKYDVNSNHRNGIDRLSKKFVVTARAPDDVIEAFEAPHKMFFMGVMWHPEFALTKEDQSLWKAFIQTSARYAAHKKTCHS